MSETPVDPNRPHLPAGESDASTPAHHGWKAPWRRHQDTDEGSGHNSAPVDPPDPPSAGQADKPAVYTADGAIHLHRHVDVVAQHIDEVILETRKRDVLEGDIQDRGVLLQQPFVRSEHWDEVWGQALHHGAAGLRQPVLIVVAPRSFGSTTFALRLLAEQTDGRTAMVKLDADWSSPSRGRLPLEKDHAYQLDLKHPVNDALSADFLNALSKHADNLRGARSSLVLTVAQDLWTDHHLGERSGIHVLRLRHAPDAQSLIEAHLDTNGYSQLVDVLRSSAAAKASVRGLSAVGAARAARTAVEALQEHIHLDQQLPQPAAADGTERLTLVQRVEAALTDWRVELDSRFGESTTRHSSDNPSLTLEDRCLLLALAVWQSAPMPQVTHSASKLQESIASSPVGMAALSPAHSAFSSRGLRRRIMDVGADVDTQDTVLFDRPAYGRAVLEYVWDNYDVMRDPLIAWLVSTAADASPEDRAVRVLTELTVRHGTVDYLERLGKITRGVRPDVLGTVMDNAVRDEHVGRLAWSMLYRWAARSEYATVVIAVCWRILKEPDVTASAAKMAMVRLRRVAQSNDNPDTRRSVLTVFEQLASQPEVKHRLVAEVRSWQQDKGSARSGGLAFMALTDLADGGMPWLMSPSSSDIDAVRAVHDLLKDTDTTAEIIPRLTAWIRTCADDPELYPQLRDQLLPALRGHNMFQAGASLMQELQGVSTTEGASVADDFYHHLVDVRLRAVFPPPGDAA
ncbi:hypothetical protein ABZV80_30340 [Streptomyces sp. NPDC005132]|uniref:hypothetical protein n=1 Tax=Streptomyces sp. NPDC005132 TaxID=3154294 RepID=UPI0033B149BE